jgi:hypothetical protein
MSASLRICDCYVRDPINRQLVVETAIITQDTTMAMRGVFAEAYVGNNEKLGESLAK